MVEKELISIIIPAYNAANYISETIEAIKKQTYIAYEVLIINDGSMDHTEEVCKRTIMDDKRFQVVSIRNQGPSHARNEGLKRAQGKYVTFIDADDYVYPEYLEYLHKLLIQYSADISCCEYIKVKRNENVPIQEQAEMVKEYTVEEALQQMYRKRTINGYPVLKLFKKEVLDGVKFPEEIHYAEDIVFVDKVIQNSQKIIYGNKILYLYYQNPKSLTNGIDIDGLKESWNYQLEYFTEDKWEDDVAMKNAIRCKQFIMALDLGSRVFKEDREFCKCLEKYAKSVASYVAMDKDNTMLQRTLGVLCVVSVRLTMGLCRAFVGFKRSFGVQMRKAV